MVDQDATAAEQEYLETIFWLQEAGLPVTAANVARARRLKPPSVHEMIVRLERDGYITRDADRVIAFTPAGRRQAADRVRRHRLIERFLTDVLGLPWDEVHEEAERLEHAMSPGLEARIRAAVGDATTCPHGHPFTPDERVEGAPLSDVELGAAVEVLRFENEAEDVLRYLRPTGLEPGVRGRVVARGAMIVVERDDDGARCAVSATVAETVSVLADPAPPPRVALPDQLDLGRERYGR